MPWKTDEKGGIVVQDGHPVFVHADGKETPFDADKTMQTLSSVNNESAARKRELREVKERFKALEGVEDLDGFVSQAKKAMDLTKNLDDKKLIDAGEAERVKAEVAKSLQAKIDQLSNETQEARAALVREMIGGRFARSQFVREKLVDGIPTHIVEAAFGKHFSIEDGRVVAKDANGNNLYSRKNPGELADFDEAIEALIEASPDKAFYLRGAPGGSNAAQGSAGSSSFSGDPTTWDNKTKSDFVAKHGSAKFAERLQAAINAKRAAK